MTPKDPFLEETFWDKFGRPIRSRALLFTPESGDSQHLEARSELQDWLRLELFTVKNYRTGPFRNNSVIISKSTVLLSGVIHANRKFE